MKKLVLGLVLSAGMAGSVYAGCSNGLCYDGSSISLQGGLYLPSLTIAQIDATTPLSGAGMMVYCNDCTVTNVCVSSGTGRGAFIIINSTATSASAKLHCQ